MRAGEPAVPATMIAAAAARLNDSTCPTIGMSTLRSAPLTAAAGDRPLTLRAKP